MNYWFELLKDNKNVIINKFSKITYTVEVDNETVIGESQCYHTASNDVLTNLRFLEGPKVVGIPCGNVEADDVDFWSAVVKLINNELRSVKVILKYYNQNREVDRIISLNDCSFKVCLDKDDYETEVEFVVNFEISEVLSEEVNAKLSSEDFDAVWDYLRETGQASA